MSEELNCTNCSIGDFKYELCDCHNGFCKEFKSIGTQEDFFNTVMQRIKPQGEWHNTIDGMYVCSNCKNSFTNIPRDGYWKPMWNYCPNCGAKMKG